MGALFGGNAGRQWGYTIGDKIVPPSIDRIDGGGPGRSGPRFEGGGLLSDIGNALMRPYGYRARQAAMQAVRPNARPPGLLTTAPMRATEADYADRFAPIPAPRVADRPDYMDMEQPILNAQRPRLMEEDYFNRLRAMGIDVDAITPVGQPMTGQELAARSRVMSQTGRPRIVGPVTPPPNAVTGPNYYSGPTYEAFRAADAHSGGMADLRRAAGTPAPAPVTAEKSFFDYLIENGLARDVAQTLADPKLGVGKRLRDTYAIHGTLGPRAIGYLQWRYGNN